MAARLASPSDHIFGRSNEANIAATTTAAVAVTSGVDELFSSLPPVDPDDDLFTAPNSSLSHTNSLLHSSSTHAFTSRRKRASLFDDDEEETTRAATPVAPSTIDDIELEKVLASFSPSLDDGRKDSIAGDDGFLFAPSTRVNEDEFDRDWLGVGVSGARPSGLFGEVDDADEDSAISPSISLPPSASPSNHTLVDRTFEVVKISKSGAHKPRRLKLTDTELQSLTSNGDVKSVAYTDIFCVTASSNSVSISFISDSDLCFQTPSARDLGRELNHRLARSRRVELEHGPGHTAPGPQHANNYQQRLFDEDATNNAQVEQTLFFTPHFGSKSPTASGGASKRSSVASAAAANSKSLDKGKAAASTTAHVSDAAAGVASAASSNPSSAPSTAHSGSVPPVVDDAWQAQYLLDQRVQSLIDHLWLDPKSGSEESKARAKFLKSAPTMLTTPTTALRATRKFLDSFVGYMERKRREQMHDTIVTKGQLLADDVFDSTWHARVERSSQVAVLMPIVTRLIDVAQSDARDDDLKLAKQCALLKDLPQSHFGIPEKHWSPSNWLHAQNELCQLEKFHLPADKIEVLLGLAKAIYQTYQHEATLKAAAAAAAAATTNGDACTDASGTAARAPGSSMFLPADDLFPILVYIVAQTPLKQPATMVAFMWQLCDPVQLSGEGGYYLTAFTSAVEYLKTVDVTKPMNTEPTKRTKK